MAVTGTQNVREIVYDALRMAQVADQEDAPEAHLADIALRTLFRMLKAWQGYGWLWLRDSMSVSLASDTASYTLSSPARPLSILSARYKGTDGIEIPMERMTRDEYDALPIKTTNGIPTTFYYDRGKEQGTLYVWPVKASVTTETIEMTVEAEIEDATDLTASIDLPAEWYEATVYNLAVRLREHFGFQMMQGMELRAREALTDAKAAAMPESVFMGFGDG